jgi:hypothetical protein
VVLIAVTVVVALLLFFVAVSTSHSSRGTLWRIAFARSIPEEQARRDFAAYAGGADRLPKSFRILKAEIVPGRDSISWYKASINPNDVAAFKESIFANRRGTISDVDNVRGLIAETNPPRWWDVQDVPDPDVLKDFNGRFVFSRKTGLVYVVWLEF